ncbi:L-2,4-diaminobutyric acid acetyltransferase [Hyphomonas neptunium ATCC 15444]|uniref:L-2,4-diaminobutyric acid acetyltransferase n=2 Tax=Hyphomonas TaxID=85 RepID=Q0C1P6_HYPNA|nr:MULTISPECIES: diaminobutyrate acetyltransferase [Hyphomonas]ABI76105.1 L-2,4-diaminobutyric acid acetyltransferase [Hyphomonas neptunium ATCC 15444]KCZ92569.1 L-2,4-diaminobutyric acid acetyltransferase [Hyphomonas hirschiana VP5]
MPDEATTTSGTDIVPDRSLPAGAADIQIAAPGPEDAAEIHALIAACPPLDTNSLYANLIQCTHFADSCAVARMGGKVVGWISGHRPPEKDDTYFLWQVAVHPDARGKSLPKRMLGNILARQAQGGISWLETSITRTNDASWGLFRSVSGWLSAPLREEPWFDRQTHFGGQHDTEFLVTIGPFEAPAASG